MRACTSYFAALFFTISLSGCASIIQGTTEPNTLILLTSSPSGAEVLLGAKILCTTPCKISARILRGGSKLSSKFGEQNLDIKIDRQGNATSLGNFLIGGITGFVVDAASGAIRTTPEQIHFDFKMSNNVAIKVEPTS